MRKRLMLGRLLLLLLLIAVLSVSWIREGAADTIDVVRSTLDAISNTAAIVEGHVTDNTYTFDSMAGPRTVATLSDVTTHFGSYRDKTLRVATLGGPISKRRWLFIPVLPRLTDDTRYLIFLTNVDWFYTPIVGDYIFRLEPGPQGTDILIDPSGHAVIGVSAAGLQLTPDPVAEDQLDFLTPHAKPRLLDSKRSQLAGAMSKEAFLSDIRKLLQTVALRGELQRFPTAGRVWNRGTVDPAPVDEVTPRAKPTDDLVCLDPGLGGQPCRDSGDHDPK
jgi:hypothetical protein